MNNSKSILFIARNIPTTKKQSNNVIITIAKKLSENYNITFLYPKPFVPFGFQYLKKYKEDWNLKDWTVNNIKVRVYTFIWLPIKNFRFYLFRKLRNKQIDLIFKEHQPEMMHAHYLFPDGILAYKISKKYKIPYVVSIRSSDIIFLEKTSNTSFDRELAGKVINLASKIHCLNHAQKNKISEFFKKDSIIIPHGIDQKYISKTNPLNYNSGPIIISCVAEERPNKNINWVINAVAELPVDNKVILNIAGDGTQNLTIPNKVINNPKFEINLLGKVSYKEVLNIMNESHIFVLPSESETFGLVYLEAAANFNAIIGLKNEGVWEIFKDKEEMLYAWDYKSFKENLISVVNDRQLQKNLAEKAHRKVQSLTSDKVMQQYHNLYNSVISA